MIEQRVLSKLLGRSESLFRHDCDSVSKDLSSTISRSKLLVIGAAGSIGGAFVQQCVSYQPRAIHLVDPNENELVEIVRHLRSQAIKLPVDFKTFAVDMGSPEFDMLVDRSGPYDHIANFAALKHVRAERDDFTLRRMIRTNVLCVDQMLRSLSQKKPTKYFCVSSDKAVAPASFMGASKALMERVLARHSNEIACSSARFANVAFSNGSLLDGFLKRIDKNQPLSGPSDIRRFFISAEEAGQLCLLSCFLGTSRDILIPLLNPECDLVSFQDIAELVLRSLGKTPRYFDSEEEAKEFALHKSEKDTNWPCVFRPSNTSGEKPIEEFVGQDECLSQSAYRAVRTVKMNLKETQFAALDNLLEELSNFVRDPNMNLEALRQPLQAFLPDFAHRAEKENLDQKM